MKNLFKSIFYSLVFGTTVLSFVFLLLPKNVAILSEVNIVLLGIIVFGAALLKGEIMK